MKKTLLILMAGVLIIASNLYAADGDLIVEGNVGIGTTSPVATLDVRGAAIFNEAGGDFDFRIAGDTDVNLFSLDAGLNTIGIGTTPVPGAKLDVTNQQVTGGIIGLRSSARMVNTGAYSGGVIGYQGGAYWQGANPVNSITLQGVTGSVSIQGVSGGAGTIAKAVGVRGQILLEAYNANQGVTDGYAIWAKNPSNDGGFITNAYGIYVEKQTVGSSINSGIALVGDGIGADLVLGTNRETKLYGSSGNLIVDTSGNVGIGTTDPQGYKLYVAGSIYTSGGYYPSDERFKKDITAIDSPLNKVLSIKGVSYSWKTEEYKDKGFSDGKHYGVIGQEIEKVLPDIVKENPNGEKSVAYTEMIPVLIEAMKEQQKIIENQKKEMEELKVKVQRLEAKDFVAKAQ